MSAETDSVLQEPALPLASALAPTAADRYRLLRWGLWAVFAVLLVVYPFLAVNVKPWLPIANFGLITAIGAIGLNVLLGYTGLASLGHAFFLGVGAYTAIYFGGAKNLGWSFLLWLPLAGIVAGIIGLGIGALTLRFRGFYLTVVTLGLAFIGGHIFLNWKDLSGGVNGTKVPVPTIGDFSWATKSTLGPFELTKDHKFYFLVLPILLLVVLFTRNLMRTRMGRAFQAVRDRESAAALLGVNVARTKIAAFVFSSVLGGICGALYASYLSYTNPDQWNLNFSIQFVAMIIIGGVASVSGSIIGAVLLAAVPQLIDVFADKLPFIQQGAGSGLTSGDFKEIIYAFFLGVFLLFEPSGIIGIYRRLKAGIVRRLNRSKA